MEVKVVIDEEPEPEGTRMGLILSFPDDSKSFTYGFEAGILYQKMVEEHDTIDHGYLKGIPVREENIDLIQQMADYHGYKAQFKTTGVSGYIGMRLTKVQLPKVLSEMIGIG
jgi:hypothetical protein